MTFRHKIIIVLVVVGVVPTLVMGYLSYRANRDELLQAVGRLQTQAATQTAQESSQYVLRSVEGLRLSASTIPFASLAGTELSEVLRIPYRQVEGTTAVL